MARSAFVLGGLNLEIGSVEEDLAIKAFQRKQLTRFIENRLIVEAIMAAGGLVAAAVTQNSTGGPKLDSLNDLLGHLKNLLLPGLADEKDEKARKVKKTIEEEIARGAFKVESMGAPTKRRRRKR